MSEESITRELFERWERVWRDGEYGLVPGCVADQYIRHDETGDRVVTPESYTAELQQLMKDRPGIRVLVYVQSGRMQKRKRRGLARHR